MDSSASKDDGARLPSAEEAITEIQLSMEQWRLAALERAGRQSGLTVGELLRRLISAHLATLASGFQGK